MHGDFLVTMPSVNNARYEAAVATFIGVLALAVSGYTAYVQRQQVRAQVIPILQYGTSNVPHIDFSVDNKGAGPAMVKHVVVTVDGQAMTTWNDVLQKLLGPGEHNFVKSDIGSLILSPGETVHILTPYDEAGEPMKIGPAGSEGARLNEGRRRIGLEICYCSTLGDCWILKSAEHASEVARGDLALSCVVFVVVSTVTRRVTYASRARSPLGRTPVGRGQEQARRRKRRT